jgi:competence protein ComEC
MNGLAQDAIAAGVALRLCVAGERLANGFALVVAPSPEHSAMSVNDRSVALRLGGPGNRLLVPGDLERAGELAATRSGLPLAADALVLSHHGSRTGSSDSFLERVRPRLALISCGFDNRFGHPHVEAIRRVRRSAVGVWRTDRDGAVWLTEGVAGWSVRASRR